MEIAMSNEWTVEVLIAAQAIKQKCKAVNLVENLFPTHIPCFLQMQKELFNIKRPVDNMLNN